MRKSGILMPVFSLPSPHGIGTFGESAYEFIDFLKNAGQSIWQILPLGPTSYGDSPYQALSSFAGNPYFIDLDMLYADGLLEKLTPESYNDRIDYGRLYKERFLILKKAYDKFIEKPDAEYVTFCVKNAWWLDDYALFSALKKEQGGAPWCEWDTPLKFRKQSALAAARERCRTEIEFEKVLQYLFDKQWRALKQYANKNGIEIMGDMPIYVSYDSADVWANPKLFELDSQLLPIEVAGCPPDSFSKDGQLWGNPLYDWQYIKSDGYRFWVERITYALSLYDILRIDHFRGFESYYAIPSKDKTARFGRWRKGPGAKLFETLGEGLPIVAEDLGFLTDEVHKLLKTVGYPGMKVLQFAFNDDPDNAYLPHNFDKNCIVYTGTHDNDTVMGWAESADESELEFAKAYTRTDESDTLNWAMIKTAMASVADTCIIPLQDFIGAGSVARINIPSTAQGNWCYRIGEGVINDWLANIILELTKLYGR